MSQNQIVSVDFHGQQILAIIHEGNPHVAMQPICENIGLHWGSQYNRIQRHPVMKSTIFITKTVAEDGKQREMLCLPLSMLNGWLFGVDVNRVREEIRPKLIRYQTECFDVLYRHFMPKAPEGRPYNPELDYDRISPAQAQDLKELVHHIAEAKVQGFGETWARLHRKFRVNSYLELPATRFAEARDYLPGKLPEEAPQPQTTAFGKAMAAARENAPHYFGAVRSGQVSAPMQDIPAAALEGIVAESLMAHQFLAGFDYRTGQMGVRLVPRGASVFDFQDGDFAQAVSAIPTKRLSELQDALNKRIARHLGAIAH